MFTRKNLWIFSVSVTLFALMDWWIVSNLTESFLSVQRLQRRQVMETAIDSIPEGDVEGWLGRVTEGERPFDILYCRGLPGLDESVEVHGKGALLSFFRSLEPEEVFGRAVESVSYQEPFWFEDPEIIGGDPRYVVFSPVASLDGYVTGLAVLSFPVSEDREYTMLVWGMGVLAMAFFSLVLFVARFSRDPFTGYVILGLFSAAAVFIAYPLFEAFRLTFLKDGAFSLETWKNILSGRQYMEALKGSVYLGGLTATLSTLVGFLFAFVLGRTRIPFRRFFGAMATLPVISPPFSLTLSVILLFGNNGLITKQLLGLTGVSVYGLPGLVLVQTMGMFPIAFLTLAGIMESIDSTLEDAAMDLSAGRWTTFRTVTLPLAMPGILSAWLLVFTNSLADFANPLILAGNFRVLSVEAYMEVTGMNRLDTGAALSIMLLFPTLTAFLVQRFWVSRRSFVTVTGKPSGRLAELTSKPVKALLVTAMLVVVAFLLSLYGTIFAGCFVKNWGIDYGFSLDNIVEAFQRGRDALWDTTVLAAMATPVAGILSMVTALVIVRRRFPGKRILEALIMTPFALPGTLVGISYILAFNKAPFVLVGTAAIIVVNYIVRELPVGVEGGIASLRQIDPSIEEAAQDLGADSPTVFGTVVLPLIRPAFISSLSYTFVRAMTAVSAVIFLISARWYHLTVLIYNFSENLRFGLASVLSTTLIIIVLCTFGLMRLLISRNENLEKNLSL